MKIFIKNSILPMFLSCCLLWSTSAESKVCFAGDGDCGGIETFGGYKDPTNDIKEQCAKAGYDRTRSDCTPGKGEQVTDYCPYDSNYVKCCSLEYQYDSCVYPMVQTGKCGNKYKCVCDTAKYKYTANGSASDCKNNSYAGGASCAQVEYNKTSMTTSSSLHFTDCICDKGAYPMAEAKCDKGAEFGEKCISINANGGTETRYASCTCDTNKYPETEETCKSPSNDKYGVNTINGYCIDGPTWHYKSCNHCNTDYPATSLDHVSGSQCTLYTGNVLRSYKTINGVLTLVLSSDDGRYLEQINGKYYAKPSQSATCGYAKCPYSYNGQSSFRYRHFNCAQGYEVKSGVCKVKACKEVVRDFVKSYTSYALLDDVTSSSSASNVLVADNVSVYSSSCTYTTGETVCTSFSCLSSLSIRNCYAYQTSTSSVACQANQFRCCTSISTNTKTHIYQERDLKCGTGRNYISAYKFARSGVYSGTMIDAMKEACTTIPTITIGTSKMPYNDAGNAGDLTFDNVNINLASTTVLRNITVKSGTVTVSSPTFNGRVTLDGNGGLMKGTSGTINFNNALSTSYFNFDVGTINFNNGSGDSIIRYPGSFAAREINLYTSPIYFYGGAYYVQNINVSASNGIHNVSAYLQNGAKWYLYKNDSNTDNYRITMNACGAFRVEGNAFIITRNSTKSNGSVKSCRYGSKQGRYYGNISSTWDSGAGTGWCGYGNNRCGKNLDCCS